MSTNDPGKLTFRERTDLRPRRKSPRSLSAIGVVLTLAGMLVLVLLVRTILERSAATAGPAPAWSAAPVRTHAELKAELAADMQSVARPDANAGAGTAVQPRAGAGGSLVYRCVGRGAAVSFQSQPCAADQETTRVIEALPDRRPGRPMQLYKPPAGEGRATYANAASPAESERDRRKRECAIAKQHHEATLKTVGLARTYDLLQRLDAQVYQACKGL